MPVYEIEKDGKTYEVEARSPEEAAAAFGPAPASADDKALGSVPGRAALGASQLVLGPLQLGANIGSFLNRNVVAPVAEALGADETARLARDPRFDAGRVANEIQRDLQASKKRGMAAHGKDPESFDAAGLIGGVATGAGLASKAKAATSVAGKILQGTATGAAFGAGAPVDSEDEDYWSNKFLQTGLGAAFGAAVPAVTSLGAWAWQTSKGISNLFTKAGPEKIATEFQKNIIGEGNLAPVINGLRNIKPTIPGANPTAAQALAGIPEGSPVIAHQAVTAQTPGGISAQFGQRALDQEAARDAAWLALNAKTAPLRETALKGANRNGVLPGQVRAAIAKTAARPGWRANELVQRTLRDVDDQIARATTNGKIDANDLYEIRKQAGTVIQKYSAETANWDKKLTAGLVSDINKAIDKAIIRAGGWGWQKYLDEYSKGAAAIADDVARAEQALKPLQKTAMAGASDVTGEVVTTFPQLLSRPVMIANAVLRWMGYAVEPRVDAVMAHRYLNPQDLADMLEKATPAQRGKIMSEMWQQYRRAVVIGAPVTAAANAVPDMEDDQQRP